MTKLAVIEPEVLSPESQKSPSGGLLADLAQKVRQSFGALHGLECEAAWRGLNIGLMLLMGKRACKHGEFKDWFAEALPEHGRSHGYRFMSLATIFVQKKHIEEKRAFMLCASNTATEPEARKVESVARKFVGNATLNDLFYEHGIKVRPSKPLGGARDKKRGAITEEMRAESEAAAVRQIIDGLSEHVLGKKLGCSRCPRKLLENLRDTLLDGHTIIAGVLKKPGH